MWSNECIQVELSDTVTDSVDDGEVSTINNGSHVICFCHR